MEVSVSRVDVVTHASHGLVVRWTLAGDDGSASVDGPDAAVDIAVGPTPDHIDHVHTWRSEPADREVHLTDLGPGRHYVSVSPAAGGSVFVAAERRVPFEGLRNFRDLGGYPSRLGGRSCWGKVFRSDALAQLTVTDLAAYQQLGLRVVYDLRGDRERLEHPNPFDSRHFPLSQPHDEQPDLSRIQTADDGEQRLLGQYVEMVETVAPSIGSLLAGLTDPGGLPAVFHCHAGKDRTGLTAALLLRALGVDRDTVLDDYQLTSALLTVEHQQDLVEDLVRRGFGRDAVVAMLVAPRTVLAGTLDHIDREHGDVERFLLGPAGLDRAVLDELRQVLLTADR